MGQPPVPAGSTARVERGGGSQAPADRAPLRIAMGDDFNAVSGAVAELRQESMEDAHGVTRAHQDEIDIEYRGVFREAVAPAPERKEEKAAPADQRISVPRRFGEPDVGIALVIGDDRRKLLRK